MNELSRKRLKEARIQESIQNAEFVLCTDLDTIIPVSTGINFQKKSGKKGLYDSFKTVVAGSIFN